MKSYLHIGKLYEVLGGACRPEAGLLTKIKWVPYCGVSLKVEVGVSVMMNATRADQA